MRTEPRRVRLQDALTRIVGAAAVTIAALVLLLPAAMVVTQSFSNEAYFSFPPGSWGLRQYRTLAEDPRWTAALVLSLRVGAQVAVLSTIIVVPAVFALYRSQLPWRNAIYAGGVTGLIIPISAYAVALYGLFAQFGLLGTAVGVVMAHATLAVPIMLLVTAAAMSRLPVELELAAMTAGATRFRASLGITTRLLLPAILSGALLAFITSFDEAVLIVFLGGPGFETLPRAILNSVRIGIDPVVTSIATMLMAGTSVLMIVAMLLARKNR